MKRAYLSRKDVGERNEPQTVADGKNFRVRTAIPNVLALQTMKIQICPSLLSADFSRLAEEIKDVEALGVDFLHLDIMDGHFVPNITIGPPVIKSLRPVTSLGFEAHLMIMSPGKYIDNFVDAGADMITLHIETIM